MSQHCNASTRLWQLLQVTIALQEPSHPSSAKELSQAADSPQRPWASKPQTDLHVWTQQLNQPDPGASSIDLLDALPQSQNSEKPQRKLLDAPDILQQNADKDASLKADTDPSAPNVTQATSGITKSSKQPVHDDAPVQDAAHQMAMQHGSGALDNASGELDSSRGLQRQLGQRFNETTVQKAVADQEKGKLQSPADANALKPEITPGECHSQRALNYSWMCLVDRLMRLAFRRVALHV